MPAPLFTKANAREMSARGNAARWSRTRPEQASNAIEANEATRVPSDDYRQRRLLRVRKQLDLVDEQIKAQAERRIPDGQTLNWLCAAQARLDEQERSLSNRPLPGTLRPRDTSKRRSEPTAEPLPSEPEPPLS